MSKVEKTWNQGWFASSLDEVAIEKKKNKRTNFTWDTNSGKLEEMNDICNIAVSFKDTSINVMHTDHRQSSFISSGELEEIYLF